MYLFFILFNIIIFIFISDIIFYKKIKRFAANYHLKLKLTI